MKRFTVLIVCILLTALACAVQPVYAAPVSYARAAVHDAYFFTEKNSASSLFAVPYTYCIEVIRDEGEWYYARYANDTGIYKSLYGYCRKEDFTSESGVPEVTFLYKTVTVKFSVNGNNSSLPVLNEISVEAAYYGTYYSGASVYSYVYCQGSFGYIEGANDDYPLNTPNTEPEKPDDNESNEKGGASGWSVGLIAFIIIAVLFVTVIAIIWLTTRKPNVNA